MKPARIVPVTKTADGRWCAALLNEKRYGTTWVYLPDEGGVAQAVELLSFIAFGDDLALEPKLYWPGDLERAGIKVEPVDIDDVVTPNEFAYWLRDHAPSVPPPRVG